MPDLLNRRTGAVKVVLAIGCALVLSVSLMSLVSRYLFWQNHLLMALVCAVPAATLATLLVAVVFGSLRYWVAMAAALVLLAALAAPQVSVLLTRAPSATGGRSLQVMTFNMLLGEADAGAVVHEVSTHQVQLLMLQELSPEALTRLQAAGIDKLLPYSFTEPAEAGHGIGLFSSLPLRNEILHPGFRLKVVSAVLTLPSGQQLTAFSSHLSAPWPQPADSWNEESGLLGTLLGSTPGLVVDAGDFNATSNFKAFRQLVEDGKVADGAAQAGAATIRTFPANRAFPPVLGIDHVLVRELKTHSLRTLSIRGSDHRAILAGLRY